MPFIQEEVRERWAEAVARYMDISSPKQKILAPEVYSKAFEIAFSLTLPNYQNNHYGDYNKGRTEAVELALELLERAKEKLAIRAKEENRKSVDASIKFMQEMNGE